MAIPIVDSHVHLWTKAQLQTLAWHSPSNPLGAQHSVEEYLKSTAQFTEQINDGTTGTSSSSSLAAATATTESCPKYVLKGFVYLEVDKISSVEEDNTEKGWAHVLDEVSFLARIAHGAPMQGDGHAEAHKALLFGIVPWAPVPGGPTVLKRYVTLVKERMAVPPKDTSTSSKANAAATEDVLRKLCGVRYLVQDKPKGTMLQTNFVEGLKWLGQQGLAFDLGVDARQGGLSQLSEAVEMIRKAYAGVEEKDRVHLIINHMCKPNLHIPPNTVNAHHEFLEWKELVTAMAAESRTTYMKLSGLFSEFPPVHQYLKDGMEKEREESDVIDSIVNHIRPWTDVIFDAFGPHRVIFGSDWPVCTVGNGAASSTEGNTGAWSRWLAVVERILDTRGLSKDEKRDVWGGVAIKAYGLHLT